MDSNIPQQADMRRNDNEEDLLDHDDKRLMDRMVRQKLEVEVQQQGLLTVWPEDLKASK